MWILTLILFCGGGTLLSTALETKFQYHPEEYENHFVDFMEKFNRKYVNPEEKTNRFEVFKQTLDKINQQNLKSEHAVYGPNEFSDLTTEEYLKYHTGYRRWSYMEDQCTSKYGINRSHSYDSEAPESFDWRDKNKVTRVKNQGYCGSCWAFSLIGNIEGQYAIKNNELLEFSEQQLVSCDKRDGGCDGGFMSTGSLELMKMGGVMTEQDYPYTSGNNKNYPCKLNKDKVKTKLSGCDMYVNMTEDKLKEVLHKVGPIAFAIDADDLQNYNGGIMTTCNYMSANHGVLLVGYGTESGIPYWTIKNSWSEKFGEKGYFRVKRGINACGVISSEIMTAVLQ